MPQGFLNWADLRLLLLLLSVDLTLFRTRMSIGDSFKDTSQADNQRHTNAHQPLTSPLTNEGYHPLVAEACLVLAFRLGWCGSQRSQRARS